MSGNSQSYEWIQQQHQKVYVPSTTEAPLAFRRLKSSIAIAPQERPEQICGIARRVGYTSARHREAIYRLKLQVSEVGFSNATIPGFFVLRNGIFVPYVTTSEAGTGPSQ